MVLEFEVVKTGAAFGGLALGVLNLGISLYKDFFRKGKLKAEVEKAEVKWRSCGKYDFVMCVNVRALGKDVYLKDVWVEHPTEVFGPYKLTSKLHVNKVTKNIVHDLLSLDADDYELKVKKIFESAEYIRDLCINLDQRRTLTITDRFNSERLMDGWLEVPLTRCMLNIDYGNGALSIPFDFENKAQSENHAYHEWHA